MQVQGPGVVRLSAPGAVLSGLFTLSSGQDRGFPLVVRLGPVARYRCGCGGGCGKVSMISRCWLRLGFCMPETVKRFSYIARGAGCGSSAGADNQAARACRAPGRRRRPYYMASGAVACGLSFAGCRAPGRLDISRARAGTPGPGPTAAGAPGRRQRQPAAPGTLALPCFAHNLLYCFTFYHGGRAVLYA